MNTDHSKCLTLKDSFYLFTEINSYTLLNSYLLTFSYWRYLKISFVPSLERTNLLLLTTYLLQDLLFRIKKILYVKFKFQVYLLHNDMVADLQYQILY